MKSTLYIRTIIAVFASGVLTAWPTAATPPYTAIIIDSGSPYFVPKSATVSTGAPIRWENPTPTEHTISQGGGLKAAEPAQLNSGSVLPIDTYTPPVLPPARHKYLSRIHPIIHATIIVTDTAPLPSRL